MPAIPFTFDPPVHDLDIEGHLVFEGTGHEKLLKWPDIDIRIKVFEGEHGYPDIDKTEKWSNGAFSRHGDFGYSIGRFHEFFIEAVPDYMRFVFGEVEVSVGDVTPLGVYFYYNQYDDDIDGGEWGSYSSVRIYGPQKDDAEIYFLNCAIRYHQKTGLSLTPFPVRIFSHTEYIAGELSDNEFKVSSCCSDLEPLRFYYYGLRHDDDTSACILLYKVVEFYAFFSHQKEIGKLRHDDSISDADFLQKVSSLLSREERGPIIRLIASITDNDILKKAAANSLVDEKGDIPKFSNSLYEFRNSIVHAKYDVGKQSHSRSFIPKEDSATHWREILKLLAWRAIERIGRHRL